MDIRHSWPDGIDSTAIVIFVLSIVLVPAGGYWLMVLDIRRYLRALRGMLMRVSYHFPAIPRWAREETPYCLRVFHLSLPCSIVQLKEAYRRRANELHPDRGGDRRHFLELQRHFELALRFLQDLEMDKLGNVTRDVT